MPLLDFPDQLPLDDQIVPANFDCEYGLPHPATFDFKYELPYTLPTPAIDCVPAEPDIYPAKDIPLTVYPFLQLHYLAECQAVDSLLLNLEKIVQHLTMGQDCITLHPH
ncbi:unnamed protein product [Gadus morhua 'NCC']